jgi:hypothetical protein
MQKKQIIIKWSYPREFENAKETELSYEGYGIYCISRKFAGKETILYIGKTVTVCEEVKSTFKTQQHHHSLLNIGGIYPKQKLTIIILEKHQ